MKTTVQCLALLLLLIVVEACGSSATPETLATSDGDVLPPGTSATQILVSPSAGQSIDDIASDLGGRAITAVPGTSWWIVSVPQGEGADVFARRMRGDGRVEDAHEDLGMHAPEGDGSTLPAGGLLIGSVIPVQPELLRIGAEVARTRATGRGVRVAVIDTGLVPHAFLEGRVSNQGWDFLDGDADPTDVPDGIDDDGDGLVDEGYGHGTFVASLVVGVAPDAEILPFRVLSADAVGAMSHIAMAIGMAADRGAHVVNVSISMNDRVRILQEAVASARARGVCVVVSAGNTGSGDVAEPWAIPDAFTVTAVDAFDGRAPFASFGPEVDLAAPGVDLLGAWPSASGTAWWSGTSFSAALVSGALALLREQEPLAAPDALEARLATRSTDLHAANLLEADLLGAGRLDLEAGTAP